MSCTDFQSIIEDLSVLGLNTDRIPTFIEFRNAYKTLYFEHPDKAGAENTGKFQEITQSARKVLKFLTANPKLQEVKNDKKDILDNLVKENNLLFNKGSVTLNLIPDTVEAWREQFKKALGDPKPLTNDSKGLQYKKNWTKDGVSYGSVSLSFWPSTNTVSLQEGNFLNFTTFALPNMVENMHKEKTMLVDDTVKAIDVEKTSENLILQ